MIMKREEGINQSMIRALDKKGKVEDIRDAVSLGYMDLQKRNNSSLLARIKRFFKNTRDEARIKKFFKNTRDEIASIEDFSENI